MNKKLHTVKVYDSDGVVLSQTVLLDDDGIKALQHGIRLAQGIDWSKTDWTRDEAINEYTEHLSGEGRQQLFEEAIDTINDIDLHEFMVYLTEDPDDPDDEDITRHAAENKAIAEDHEAKARLGIYVSGDDVELDPETAAQYRADRKADDAPENA